jgi:microcystin degradation protein MlrC
MKRVAILGTFLESNKYSLVVAGNRFRCLYGNEILDDLNSNSPKLLKEGLGFVSQMNKGAAWQLVPIGLVLGGAGGPADATFMASQFEAIKQNLERELPLDGVYILKHGAMTTTEDLDPDGTLYSLVRGVVGNDVSIVTTVDLHANISTQMVESVDAIVSYRTDPHVDQFQCGEEAATLLIEMMDGMKTSVSHIRLPIIPPNVSLLTAEGPYADLIEMGQRLNNAEVANISIVGGFAYSDTPDNGLHIIVTTKNNPHLASALCKQLAGAAWSMKERFLWNLLPIDEAVEMAVSAGRSESTPLILADLGDNIGAGGPGNTLTLLRALTLAQAENVVFGSFHDPALVYAAEIAGEGAQIDATFRGDGWDNQDPEFEINQMRISSLHPGQFPITEGPLAGMTVNSGSLCLLEKKGIHVLVTSHRPLVWPDPALLADLGIDLSKIRTLVLKCRSSYRAVFHRYFDTDRMVEVDTPGRTSPVLTRHDWENLPRPAYPLDQNFEWELSAAEREI